jgi:hypothetical protein
MPKFTAHIIPIKTGPMIADIAKPPAKIPFYLPPRFRVTGDPERIRIIFRHPSSITYDDPNETFGVVEAAGGICYSDNEPWRRGAAIAEWRASGISI